MILVQRDLLRLAERCFDALTTEYFVAVQKLRAADLHDRIMTAAPIVVEETMQQVVADHYCTNPRASLLALQVLRLHHRLRDQISAEELEQMHPILDIRKADVQRWEVTATRFELEEKLSLASIPAVKEGEKQIRTNEWLFLVMRENPDLARLHRSMTSKLAARHIGPGDWARLALKFWLSDSISARIPVYAESSISTTQEGEVTVVVVAKQDINSRIEQVTNPVNNEELVASAATVYATDDCSGLSTSTKKQLRTCRKSTRPCATRKDQSCDPGA